MKRILSILIRLAFKWRDVPLSWRRGDDGKPKLYICSDRDDFIWAKLLGGAGLHSRYFNYHLYIEVFQEMFTVVVKGDRTEIEKGSFVFGKYRDVEALNSTLGFGFINGFRNDKEVELYNEELDRLNGLTFGAEKIKKEEIEYGNSLPFPAFVVGTDHTIASYGGNFSRYIKITNAINFEPAGVLEKNGKDVLFITSHNFLHRGLVEVIEATSARGVNLHVIGNFKSNQQDFKIYKRYKDLPFVHFHGAMELSSEAFRRIVSRCSLQVYNSIAEGLSGCVVSGLVSGLPVYCKDTCAPEFSKFIHSFSEFSVDEMLDLIDFYSKGNFGTAIQRQYASEFSGEKLKQVLRTTITNELNSVVKESAAS